jgi:hypothetical protein
VRVDVRPSSGCSIVRLLHSETSSRVVVHLDIWTLGIRDDELYEKVYACVQAQRRGGGEMT